MDGRREWIWYVSTNDLTESSREKKKIVKQYTTEYQNNKILYLYRYTVYTILYTTSIYYII